MTTRLFEIFNQDKSARITSPDAQRATASPALEHLPPSPAS